MQWATRVPWLDDVFSAALFEQVFKLSFSWTYDYLHSFTHNHLAHDDEGSEPCNRLLGLVKV